MTYIFQIIAEPGRYVVASAFTLATNIVAKREVNDDNGSLVSTMYYINDGVYGSFNCVLYDHQEVNPDLLEVMFCSIVLIYISVPRIDYVQDKLSDV